MKKIFLIEYINKEFETNCFLDSAKNWQNRYFWFLLFSRIRVICKINGNSVSSGLKKSYFMQAYDKLNFLLLFPTLKYTYPYLIIRKKYGSGVNAKWGFLESQ